ncbi:hypothetical protein LXA43DRAFT_1096521 [Ganoderma leucocontextum]|nr:hypothetical protein LXA43DRAFT_1096521 [Ganoderma leucocontextum]
MEHRPPVFIDTVEKLDEALSYWKNTTFSQHYLKLDDVVESFQKPNGHLVDARQEFAARWLLCPPGGKKPATLWTAGVWRWSSDLDTGNFVPPGETAPARLPENRIQTIPNNLCRFTYVLDTTHDKSLWHAQAVFEEYVTNVNKFNPGKKGRREFQNGLSHTHTFHFSSQMFVKRTAYTRAKEASRAYPLHDWIKNATKKGMPYFANDEKPVLFEPDNAGGLRPLSEGFPPTLKVGDLVWMSFAVEFFIGNKFWSTNFIPYEFVRVGSVALELLPEIKKEFDEDEDEEGPRERLGVGMRGISAAAARHLNAVGDQPPVPPAEQPEPTANTNEFVPLPDNPERSHDLLRTNLERPRTPRAFIDSEKSTTGDETDEEEIGSGAQPDDSDSMMQDYMSLDDNSSIIDDDSSLTDDTASFTDAGASFIDDSVSAAGDDAPAIGADASLAENAASAADDDASVVAPTSPTVSDSKLLNQLNIVNQPEVVKQLAPAPRASSKPKGKKRPASSERPPVDVVAGESMVVGTRVLRKRIAKGNGIAKGSGVAQ